MRSFPNFIRVVACVFLGVAAIGAKKEEKPKGDKPKQTKKEPAKKKGAEPKPDATDAADDQQNDKGRMSLPIPKGHDSKGLKIPYYDSDGHLQMIFTIGIANRVDEDHVRMSELQVETFDDKEKSEMVIDLPTSIIDLNTRIITTNLSVTIKRSDFELTGHTMEFNTITKQGKLGGGVRMLIYDRSDIVGAKPEAESQPEEERLKEETSAQPEEKPQ
jgi:hypothetical protein